MDGSLENFKSKHKDVGFIDCTFKTTQVTLYNLTRDIFADTEGYNKLDFKILFWSIQDVISFNFELILSIWIFGYQAINGGLINYVTLWIMIFAIFIEENLGKSVWWKVLYVTFLLIELIKVVCKKS